MDFFKNSMQKFRLFGRGKSVKHNLKKCRLYRKNGMVDAAGVRYYLGIGAGAACDPYKTFPLKAYHSAVLRAMIGRDKNHPCVVLWSLGNEPDTEHFPQSAYDYWRPLYEQAHAQDPQDRPVTMVCCQNDYTRDITTRTMDVVCINRYYGWYNLSGDLENAAYLRKLGIPADKAYQWGNSRLEYWRIAGSPVLKRSITNKRLAAAGYFSILDYYESLHLCG